jgi:hypothetical protein
VPDRPGVWADCARRGCCPALWRRALCPRRPDRKSSLRLSTLWSSRRSWFPTASAVPSPELRLWFVSIGERTGPPTSDSTPSSFGCTSDIALEISVAPRRGRRSRAAAISGSWIAGRARTRRALTRGAAGRATTAKSVIVSARLLALVTASKSTATRRAIGLWPGPRGARDPLNWSSITRRRPSCSRTRRPTCPETRAARNIPTRRRAICRAVASDPVRTILREFLTPPARYCECVSCRATPRDRR